MLYMSENVHAGFVTPTNRASTTTSSAHVRKVYPLNKKIKKTPSQNSKSTGKCLCLICCKRTPNTYCCDCATQRGYIYKTSANLSKFSQLYCSDPMGWMGDKKLCSCRYSIRLRDFVAQTHIHTCYALEQMIRSSSKMYKYVCVYVRVRVRLHLPAYHIFPTSNARQRQQPQRDEMWMRI